MSHKKTHGAPVPPGNQPQAGPEAAKVNTAGQGAAEISSAQEQDPKRRLGGFEGKGEHSMQEPGGKQGSGH